MKFFCLWLWFPSSFIFFVSWSGVTFPLLALDKIYWFLFINLNAYIRLPSPLDSCIWTLYVLWVKNWFDRAPAQVLWVLCLFCGKKTYWRFRRRNSCHIFCKYSGLIVTESLQLYYWTGLCLTEHKLVKEMFLSFLFLHIDSVKHWRLIILHCEAESSFYLHCQSSL